MKKITYNEINIKNALRKCSLGRYCRICTGRFTLALQFMVCWYIFPFLPLVDLGLIFIWCQISSQCKTKIIMTFFTCEEEK